MNATQPVTLKITLPDGKVWETTTREYEDPEEALKNFKSIHKDSIQRYGWKVTVKGEEP
jgi:hypothetical protein